MTSQMISSSIFSGGQIALITLAVLVIAALIALNIWFAYIWRIQTERKLYNESLQDRREALLAKLAYLNGGGEASPQEWLYNAYEAEGDEDEEEDEDETVAASVPTEAGVRPMNTVVLEVNNLTPSARAKLGMRAKRFNDKRFYVRYALGFDAKLRFSDDETKERYVSIMDEIRAYGGVTLEKAFTKQQIMLGGELLGSLLFLGKRLCVAFALDPKEYENEKYRGEDKSDKKRFAKTPMLVRIISDNKVEAVKFLLAELATKYGAAKGAVKNYKYDMKEKSQMQLLASGSVRVVIIDEIPAGAEIPEPVSMRDRFKSNEVAAAATEEKEETKEAPAAR